MNNHLTELQTMKLFNFQTFFKEIEDHFAVLNLGFEFLEINQAWVDSLKQDREHILTKGLLNYVLQEDQSMVTTLLNGLKVGEYKSDFRVRLLSSPSDLFYITLDVQKLESGFQLRARDKTLQIADREIVAKAAEMGELGAWYHDPINDLSHWDDVIYHIYDLDITQKINHQTVVSHYHPHDKEKMESLMRRLYNDHQSYDVTTRIITQKKNVKWIRVMASPIVDNGEIIRVNGFVQDISARQRLFEKMRSSNEQKYLALKGIKSGVFDYDLRSNKIEYSPDFAKMLGRRGGGDIGDFRDLIHPEDKAEANIRFHSALSQSGNYYENHFRLRNRKGDYRYYEVHGWRQKDEGGHAVRVVGNLIDVHERVMAQQKRDEYSDQLKALLNNGLIQSVLLDKEGCVLMADHQTKDIGILEYGSDPIASKAYFGDILRADERRRFEQELPRVLKGERVRKEVQHIYSNGAIGWLEVTYNPIESAKGEIMGLVISFMDIGKRKFTEIEKRYNKSRLDEVNRMKANIIGNLSHEIRTPLNGIITVSELLPEVSEEEELKQLLEIQKKSADRLLETIDGLINLSRIEAEKSNLEMLPVEVSSILADCVEKFIGQAERKALFFEFENCPVGIKVNADKIMLEQCFINLINNALKFTLSGGISVKSFVEDQYIKILVQDTGVGISLENQERIFSEFEQESGGHSRAFEGVGIGLSFTKKFLEMIGGQIDVVSIKGDGSLFTIKLPVLL